MRPRVSRIYYDGKFYDYPLKAFNALLNMGVWRSFTILLSYIQFKLFPYPKEETFEQWVTNRFGKRLFEIFFKTYTEKVWGIPTSEIRAEWAAQRIKGLSLFSAVRNALFRPRNEQIKTLIEEFHYPKRGPGMMWERVVELVRERGGEVMMDAEAVKVLVLCHKNESLGCCTIPDVPVACSSKTKRKDVCRVGVEVDEIVGEARREVLIE